MQSRSISREAPDPLPACARRCGSGEAALTQRETAGDVGYSVISSDSPSTSSRREGVEVRGDGLVLDDEVQVLRHPRFTVRDGSQSSGQMKPDREPLEGRHHLSKRVAKCLKREHRPDRPAWQEACVNSLSRRQFLVRATTFRRRQYISQRFSR